MGDEQNKRISRRTQPPPQQENLLNSDFVLALALQEQLQERDFSMLPTVESESDEEHDIVSDDDDEEEEEEEEEDYDYSEEDYAFLQSQEIEAELRYTEGEDNDNNQELMEEDDIDPDELSYEELIALGEMVGEENKGLSAEQISASVSPYMHPYYADRTKTIIDRCVICQVEYKEGEKLVAIPCEHPYHSDCISEWLRIKKICPICGAEVSPSTANL